MARDYDFNPMSESRHGVNRNCQRPSSEGRRTRRPPGPFCCRTRTSGDSGGYRARPILGSQRRPRLAQASPNHRLGRTRTAPVSRRRASAPGPSAGLVPYSGSHRRSHGPGPGPRHSGMSPVTWARCQGGRGLTGPAR